MPIAWLEPSLARLACIAAFAAGPWMFARLVLPHANWVSTTAVAGISAIVWNTLIPLTLHVLRIPIAPLTLAAPHLALMALLLVISLLLRRSPRPPLPAPPACRWIALGFAVLVLPVTHLAGIDTYKWQGLATNVRVEASIPWLVHPASLLGFTPRAYPPIQPLLLSSIQILGGVGVDVGFYLVSLLSGLTGLALAHTFARRYYNDPRHATWFTFFFVFSPIFMRYNHWATGRGFFLALFPAFLLALMEFPRRRSLIGLPLACLLLALTHKVGLVAVALLLPARLVALLLPRTDRRWPPLLLAIPFVIAAVILSPPFLLSAPAGCLPGFLRSAITRFGWMLPAAAVALALPCGWLTHPNRRALFPAMLVTLPLAFPSDMYGAMLALPFVTLAATDALFAARECLTAWSRHLAILAIALTLAAALAIVADRTRAATPPRVWRAAQFLERHDPRGPFQIHAPGRPRVQMHAYVSGCPRFVVTPGTNHTVTWRTWPSWQGPPAQAVRRWIDFGRNFMELSDVAVDWYGVNPRTYYVIIDGQGDHPQNPEPLYDADNIQILQPAGQIVTH